MCSISGIINGDLNSLKKMIDVQSHRAPDENGYYKNKNIPFVRFILAKD